MKPCEVKVALLKPRRQCLLKGEDCAVRFDVIHELIRGFSTRMDGAEVLIANATQHTHN